MRKDKKMTAHVTKNGYKYYTAQKSTPQTIQVPKEKKWKKGLGWIGRLLLTGLKNLPGLIMRVAILMVTTPMMILLFILNLIKMLLVIAIGWVIFKIIIVLGYAAVWELYSWLTKSAVPSSVDSQMDWLMTNFYFPHGVPIHYWWETTIIVVLAVITAFSLTFHLNKD